MRARSPAALRLSWWMIGTCVAVFGAGCSNPDDLGVGQAAAKGGIPGPPDASHKPDGPSLPDAALEHGQGLDSKASDVNAGDAAEAEADAADSNEDVLDATSEDSALAEDATGADTAGDGVEELVPFACGDGVRDPNTEECDDATGSSPQDSCSAYCTVTDLLVLPKSTLPDGGPAPKGRTLGNGRHPVSAGDAGFAVVFADREANPPKLGITTFGPLGAPRGNVLDIGVGSTVVSNANPVVAALPAGMFAAAWTSFNDDGDELGVALRLVDPGSAVLGNLGHANATTAFSQYDPDVLWTGSQLVVAWVDESDPWTGPDVKYRTFSASLLPTSGEVTLANGPEADANVALAPFAGSWAAAWRSAGLDSEAVVVKAGSTTWTIPTIAPAPDDRPALAELDSTHLLVMYTEAVDMADAGVFDGSQIRAAVLDAVSNSVTEIGWFGPEQPLLPQSEPNAIRAGDHVYTAWRQAAAPGDLSGEDVRFKELGWSSSTGIDTLPPGTPLPRQHEHTSGDQRRPALAASPLAPSGALVAAWDDLGYGFGPSVGNGNIVVEFAPLPLLRLTDSSSCPADSDPCKSCFTTGCSAAVSACIADTTCLALAQQWIACECAAQLGQGTLSSCESVFIGGGQAESDLASCRQLKCSTECGLL